MKTLGALWRIALSVMGAIVLLTLLANVIRQPVTSDVHRYTAEFTDASGLHLDADVRVRGVRVGKVQTVDLKREGGQSVASVGFTLAKQYGVVPETRLAIKYQALTGLRYIDIADPSEQYSTADLVRHVPTAMTRPSFDITALFNGLQPVIATLSPEEVNTFTENAISYLSGDGAGLAPMLESIHRLTKFASDRQQVVAILMQNLSDLAASMGGHSKHLVQILDYLNRPLDGVLDAIDEFRKSQLFGPAFTGEAIGLFTSMGLKPDTDSSRRFRLGASPDEEVANDAEYALDRAFTNLDDFIDAFKLVPVMWENIPPPPGTGAPLPCSRGTAQLPEQMDILVNGQRVVLCNR